jgi:hypothetical protein
MTIAIEPSVALFPSLTLFSFPADAPRSGSATLVTIKLRYIMAFARLAL